MIETTEELREFLHNGPQGNTIKEASRNMVQTLEAVFANWSEDTLGALMVDVGMLLGARRGEAGMENLISALEALKQLLVYGNEHRRRMN